MFLNEEESWQFYADWEQRADAIVATVRGYAGKHPHDKGLTDLIGELDDFISRGPSGSLTRQKKTRQARFPSRAAR